MTLIEIYLDSVLVESHSNVTAQQTFTGAYGSVVVTPTAYKDTIRRANPDGPGSWIETVDDVDCQIWSVAANAANGKRFDFFGARFVNHTKMWTGPNESSAQQYDQISDASTRNNPYSGSVTPSGYSHNITGPVEGERFYRTIWPDPNDTAYSRINREFKWLRVYFLTTHVYTGLLIRNGAGTGLLRGASGLILVDA